MSAIHKRGRADLNANLTPMIDVTFLLIVFFVLVSQIVEVENVDMALPELTEPESAPPETEMRSVINVVPDARGRAAQYRIGGAAFAAAPDGVEQLTKHLTGLLEVNPGLRVNLRADQHTHYEWVEPVLLAVSVAASRVPNVEVAPRINLVVTRED